MFIICFTVLTLNYHKLWKWFCDSPSRTLGSRLTALQGTDPNPFIMSSLWLHNRSLVGLVFLEPKTSPLNNTCHQRTRLAEVLLKGEVLGSRNAKRTNNLIMKSERTHNGGVGSVPCRAVSMNPSERDGLSQKKSAFMWQPVPRTRNPAHSPAGHQP